jgi:hypothetical protein
MASLPAAASNPRNAVVHLIDRLKTERRRARMTKHGNADTEAEQRFEQLAARFLADPTVTEGTGFGANN